MYIPKPFAKNDQSTLYNFIRSHSFGILFSHTDKGPFATHLPFILDENKGENGRLLSHMAKANPHWKSINHQEILIVFPGPHAYISPTWYGEPQTVPTWNYVAVHVYGTCQIIEDIETTKKILEATVNYYEASLPNPWTVRFEEEYVSRELNGLVAFEINIAKIEGKWKLSQNHSIERQRNLAENLASSNKYNSVEIAKLIEENIKSTE